MIVAGAALAGLAAGGIGFALGALHTAHRVRTGRARWEPRFAAGGTPAESVTGAAAVAVVGGVVGGVVGAACDAWLAGLFAAAAGVAGGIVGRAFALRRLFAEGAAPEEDSAPFVFRNAPPIKTYDPDVRPAVQAAEGVGREPRAGDGWRSGEGPIESTSPSSPSSDEPVPGGSPRSEQQG